MALSELLRKQSVLALVASDYSYRVDRDLSPGHSLRSFPDSSMEDEQACPRALLFTFSPEERDLPFSPCHSNHPGTSQIVEFDNRVVERSFATPGANVNAVTREGWTPPMAAAARGSDALVSMLMDLGANVNVKNTAGQTAWDVARANRKFSTVAVLQRIAATD